MLREKYFPIRGTPHLNLRVIQFSHEIMFSGIKPLWYADRG